MYDVYVQMGHVEIPWSLLFENRNVANYKREGGKVQSSPQKAIELPENYWNIGVN